MFSVPLARSCLIAVLGLAIAGIGFPQSATVPQVSPLEDKLVQARGSAPIYLVRGGKKYPIQSPNWLGRNGYTWQGVRVLNPSEVAAIPSGYPLELQTPIPPRFPELEGALIQARGMPSIYLVRDGKKHPILDPNWIPRNNLKLQDIRVLESAQFEAIPPAADLALSTPAPGRTIPDSGLISAPDGRVFVVEQGKRRWIIDGRWIANSRYANQQSVPVSDAELQSIPAARDITYTPPIVKLLIAVLVVALLAFLLLMRASARKPSFFESRPESDQGKSRTWTPQRIRLGLFLVFASAIALREPYLILHPRFWAEEGTGFFAYAASHSVLQALYYVFPESGYLNLFPNVASISAALTARTLGLEFAPAATTFVAFLIQALAIGLITFGKSPLFNSPWKAAAGCLIVLFAPTATYEIWLNSINSMSFFGLISLLLLFEPVETWRPRLRWLSRGALLMGGLSSLYSVALLPLFGLSAWQRREREQKIACGILTACLLMQIGFVVTGRMAHAGALNLRVGEVRLETSLVNVFGAHILFPSLASPLQEDIIDGIGLREAWVNASSFPPRPPTSSQPLAGCFCFVMIAGILWQLAGSRIDSPESLMLGAFLTFSVLTCVGSLHSVPLGRYAYLPGAAFLFLLLIKAESSESRVIPYVCILVLSYSLATGLVRHPRVALTAPGEPSWSSEVAVWRKDPSHPLRIWPSWWTATIPGNLVEAH